MVDRVHNTPSIILLQFKNWAPVQMFFLKTSKIYQRAVLTTKQIFSEIQGDNVITFLFLLFNTFMTEVVII